MIRICRTRTVRALTQDRDQAITSMENARVDAAECVRKVEEQVTRLQGDLHWSESRVSLLERELGLAQQATRDSRAVHAELVTFCRQYTQLAHRLEALEARVADPRSTGSPAAEVPEDAVLAFRTLGGGTVVVVGKPKTFHCDRYLNSLPEPVDGFEYLWQCLTCRASSDCYSDRDLDVVRPRANEHAAECRAVPLPLGG